MYTLSRRSLGRLGHLVAPSAAARALFARAGPAQDQLVYRHLSTSEDDRYSQGAPNASPGEIISENQSPQAVRDTAPAAHTLRDMPLTGANGSASAGGGGMAGSASKGGTMTGGLGAGAGGGPEGRHVGRTDGPAGDYHAMGSYPPGSPDAPQAAEAVRTSNADAGVTRLSEYNSYGDTPGGPGDGLPPPGAHPPASAQRQSRYVGAHVPKVHPGQVESSDTTGLSPEMEGVPVEMRPAGQSSG